MCAVRADGFLPSKVSMLGGSNDCIRAFSPENYHFSSQVMFFGKGRLLFRELAVSAQNPHRKKNSLRKASTQNKFLPISNSRGQFSLHISGSSPMNCLRQRGEDLRRSSGHLAGQARRLPDLLSAQGAICSLVC